MVPNMSPDLLYITLGIPPLTIARIGRGHDPSISA